MRKKARNVIFCTWLQYRFNSTLVLASCPTMAIPRFFIGQHLHDIAVNANWMFVGRTFGIQTTLKMVEPSFNSVRERFISVAEQVSPPLIHIKVEKVSQLNEDFNDLFRTPIWFHNRSWKICNLCQWRGEIGIKDDVSFNLIIFRVVRSLINSSNSKWGAVTSNRKALGSRLQV